MTTDTKTMTVAEADEAITDARTAMLLDHSPYFGMLALRLKPTPKADGAISVDGTRLFFNPDYVAKLTQPELVAEVARAVMTCSLRLPYRMQGRDPKIYNKAANCRVYPLLRDAGFTLRKDAPMDPRFDKKGEDMAIEEIYAVLEEEAEKEQQGGGGNSGGGAGGDGPTGSQKKPDPKKQDQQQGQGKSQKQQQPPPKPNPADDDFCQPAPEPDPQAQGQPQPGPAQESDGTEQEGEAEGSVPNPNDDLTETDWQIAAEQVAAITRKAGTMPGDIDRNLQSGRGTQTDWRDTLRRFVQQVLPTDYCWSRPNKRFIGQGLYLAGVLRENMPKIIVMNDTSGSVSGRYQQLVADELTTILHEMRPEEITVMHGDTRVCSVDHLTPDDGEVKLSAKGGGGTSFQPFFDAMEQTGEDYACIIFFSEDLEHGDQLTAPEKPVLWLIPEHCHKKTMPFGEVVTVRMERN